MIFFSKIGSPVTIWSTRQVKSNFTAGIESNSVAGCRNPSGFWAHLDGVWFEEGTNEQYELTWDIVVDFSVC